MVDRPQGRGKIPCVTSKYHRRGLPRLDQSQDLERDAAVVALRNEGATFRSIGEMLGITRQRATQLYDRATAPEPEVPVCWCGTPIPRVPDAFRPLGGRPPGPQKYCSPEHAPEKQNLRRKYDHCHSCGTAYAELRPTPSCRNCSAVARIRRAAYDELAEAQDHLCAICRSPETAQGSRGAPRRLAVDHCHAGGGTRELLCMKCNLMIGNANDSPEILEAAAAYLRKHAS